MAVDRGQASRDLDLKLRLEDEFRRGLRRADTQLVREVTVSVGVTGGLPDVEALTVARVAPLLDVHYDRVSDAFSDRIRDQLPEDVESTATEDALIAATLAATLTRRRDEQARRIGGTNESDARLSLAMSREQGREEGLSRQEIGVGTGVLFTRKLRGREGGRACLETQASAELSKQVEADVLASEELEAQKEWVTVGDDVVRPHHLAVDSVQVLVSQAFSVNAQRLMYPGDTSLGATASNVVNCRCASVPDVDAIAASRRA